jgi:hypothetical protein
MLVERSRFGRAVGLRRGVRGWAFTFVVVAAPACALFHPPFVCRIVMPLIQAMGAIP